MMILKTGKAERRASGFTLFRPPGAALLRVRGLRFAS
jgi:hypothetical protein